MGISLLVLLVILLIAVIPIWHHSRKWGYAPTGGLGVMVVITLWLVFMRAI